VQERYGIAREEAERQVKDWEPGSSGRELRPAPAGSCRLSLTDALPLSGGLSPRADPASLALRQRAPASLPT
jgi:hypothetical protein